MLVQLKRERLCRVTYWFLITFKKENAVWHQFPTFCWVLFCVCVCVLLFFFLSFEFHIHTTCPNYLLSRGCGTHAAFSLSLVFPSSSSLVLVGAAGLPCVSPLAAAVLGLGSSLSVPEGYIHWLVPAGDAPLLTWRGALRRRCPAGASVPAVWPAEWSLGSSSVQSGSGTVKVGGVNEAQSVSICFRVQCLLLYI